MIRVLLVTAACLVWLGGCTTTKRHTDGTGRATPAPDLSTPRLLGSDPHDDLSLGKKQFRASNYGLAEQHFRKAVEQHPKDVEAWLGLAASYDRLRRFDLADRAYRQVLALVGPTAEVLNNQGFSYMLRGDYARARQTLRRAQRLDPKNPYIHNNIELLNKSIRTRRAIE